MTTRIAIPGFDLPLHVPTLVKRGLRSSADLALRMSGVLAQRERAMVGKLSVLTYHRVLPRERCVDYPFPSLAMPLDLFREQVRWLVEHGEVLTLSEALACAGEPCGRPVFALTFDDGYQDASEFVAEVLEDAGIRGTFFVTTGFVGTDELLWFDRAALLVAELSESILRAVVREVCPHSTLEHQPAPGANAAAWTHFLKTCRPDERAEIVARLEFSSTRKVPRTEFCGLSVEQLIQLHRRGHEIGSHTVSHAMLPDLDDATLERELRESRDMLAGWIGERVSGFCYPNGDHDERSVAAVQRAGHAYACTTRDGTHAPEDDPYRIRRVNIAADRVIGGSRQLDEMAFRRELCGLYRQRR